MSQDKRGVPWAGAVRAYLGAPWMAWGLTLGLFAAAAAEKWFFPQGVAITRTVWFYAAMVLAGLSMGLAFKDFWASVKVTVVLLLLVALACVTGTLITQNAAPQAYFKIFGPTWGRVVLGSGLGDVYHAAWFIVLLLALAQNLIVCSVSRFSRTWKIVRRPLAEAGRKVPSGEPAASVEFDFKPEELESPVREHLTGRMRHVQVREGEAGEGGGYVVYGERGRWTRLGMYVVHLSVLIIFAGGIIGAWFGFSGSLKLLEGQTKDRVALSGGGFKKLPFAVRCDRFTIQYYDTGQPSEYISNVSVIEQGRVVERARIIVNLRMIRHGIAFMQSSYGSEPKEIVLAVTGPDKKEVIHRFTSRRRVMLPHIKALFMVTKVGRTRARPGNRSRGAVQLTLIRFIKGQKRPIHAHLALAEGQTRQSAVTPGYKYRLKKVNVRFYTVLSVKYDPGVDWIWIGSGLMCLGFILTFYMSHRKVWLVVSPAENGSRVDIYAAANKKHAILKNWAGQVLAKLQKRVSPHYS